jgi:hypothetical protein
MASRYNKIEWLPETDAFLRNNWDKKSNKDLAAAIGMKLSTVRKRLYQLGLKRMEQEYWTDEMVVFLKENYRFHGDKKLAEIFQKRYPKQKAWTLKHIEKKRNYLGLHRSKEELQAIKARQTKEGVWKINHWRRWADSFPINTIRVWHWEGQPRKVIKRPEGYILLAPYIYQKEIGPIPAGHIVTHKDKDPLNCEPDNLESISREENALRNSGPLRLTDNYIAGILTIGNKEIRSEVLKNKGLIDLKRQSILLGRVIKKSK